MRSGNPRRTFIDPAESKAIALAQEDGLSAMRWVRARTGEYGINPARIGIIGVSIFVQWLKGARLVP